MRKNWFVTKKGMAQTCMLSAVLLTTLFTWNARECKGNTGEVMMEAVIEEENAPDGSVENASLGYEWTVKVDQGYLALRTKKAYDVANEIGELYTGDSVEVLDSSDQEYWYVYAPNLDKSGYVNKEYLFYHGDSQEAYNWSVEGVKNYLALRTEKAYDASNEIGRLYEGDVLTVKKAGKDKYWYVYVPKLDQFGYVNKEYLKYNASDEVETKTVSVKKGYLALRTGKAYDAANEIGELYTGDEVEVLYPKGKQYWYVYAPSLNKVGYVDKNYLR